MSDAPGTLLAVLGGDTLRPFRVLAYGDPNVDLMYAAPRTPASGEKIVGRKLGRFAGGTVANAGCAASFLGCRTQAMGRVGDDEDGRFLLAAYARHGVSTHLVRTIVGEQSASAMIMLEPGGEKALVYAPLAGSPYDPAILREALATSALLYAMPYDIAEFAQVQAMARASATIVAIDVEVSMVQGTGDIERLFGLADLVFMNDATYRSLFGCAPDFVHMRSLIGLGARALVVSCGARGAMAVTARDSAGQPAFPATMVDSTGAGDCFSGAFLAAMFEGASLSGCLRFACAAASFAVARLGAREGIPSLRHVEQLLASEAA